MAHQKKDTQRQNKKAHTSEKLLQQLQGAEAANRMHKATIKELKEQIAELKAENGN